MSRDPLAALYEDLERGDYDPRGPEHDFRSRCPGHGGDSHSLHVCEGVDRRAVLYCFAHQCEPATIMAALGRSVRDLFPDDDGTPYRPGTGQRKRADVERDATATLLAHLGMAGIGWHHGRLLSGEENPDFFVADYCPACASPRMLIQRASEKETIVSCAMGCKPRAIRACLRIGELV